MSNYPYYYRDQLLIELTNHCNIKCRYCINPTIPDEKRGVMALPLFKSIVDQAHKHPFISSINLVGMGEIFMNPHIVEMMEYVEDIGIDCYSCTNLKYDLTEKRLGALLRFHNIHATIDAVTNETLHKTRPDTEVSLLWNNVRKIIERKKSVKSDLYFEVRMNVFAFNKHEMWEVIDRAESYGVDSIWIAKGSGPREVQTELTERDFQMFADRNIRSSGFQYSSQENMDELTQLNTWRKRKVEQSNILDRMDCTAPTVHWNGRYSPCCFDFLETIEYGDMNSQSLEDLWSKHVVDSFEKMLLYGEEFRRKSGKKIACDSCPNFLKYKEKKYQIFKDVDSKLLAGHKLNQALALLEQQRYNEALAIVMERVHSYASDPLDYLFLGMITDRIGLKKQSCEMFQKSKKLANEMHSFVNRVLVEYGE